MGYVIVFVIGIAVATVGFSGVANIFDKGVAQVQQMTKEVAK